MESNLDLEPFAKDLSLLFDQQIYRFFGRMDFSPELKPVVEGVNFYRYRPYSLTWRSDLYLYRFYSWTWSDDTSVDCRANDISVVLKEFSEFLQDLRENGFQNEAVLLLNKKVEELVCSWDY
jgi:hypothetical protein